MARVRLLKLLLFLFSLTFLSLMVFNIWVGSGIFGRESSKKDKRSDLFMADDYDGKLEPKHYLNPSKTLTNGKLTENYFENFGNPSSSLNNSWHSEWNFKARPWFMVNGSYKPEPQNHLFSKLPVWPEEGDTEDDRIINQLMYLPENYDPETLAKKNKLKRIVLYFDRSGWRDLPLGQTKFLSDKCPVNTCYLTSSRNDIASADAVFFKDRFQWPKHHRNPNQIWILFMLECSLHTQSFKGLRNVFNWTATYRHDSDIVAPYEKLVPYHDVPNAEHKNWAEGKTKKVAWFVSNCGAKNKRLQYARELGKYIDVDIYGSCGEHKCPRIQVDKCFQLLNSQYKFYLSFENSNCRDYITEKFFINGLGNNILPIVMGGRPDDYKRASPPRSFIHIDDFDSPQDLAKYLLMLDNNDKLYSSYFHWKGRGEFINTYFWCRLCALLHAPLKPKTYSNIAQWWGGRHVCNTKSANC